MLPAGTAPLTCRIKREKSEKLLFVNADALDVSKRIFSDFLGLSGRILAPVIKRDIPLNLKIGAFYHLSHLKWLNLASNLG